MESMPSIDVRRQARGLAGRLVIEARQRAGLTQRELASRAGLPTSVVSRVETGKREATVPTIAHLVAAAGLALHLEVRDRDEQDDLAELVVQLLVDGSEADRPAIPDPALVDRGRLAPQLLDLGETLRRSVK
jgi:transcriptional regulator with XRE-family HTH domain